MELKRDLIKYIRDKAKARYNKGTECFICGSEEDLDFHHYNGMTEMLERWLKKTGKRPATAEDIMQLRDEFIEVHYKEIYELAVTLCHTHHLKLHSIYGKKPTMATAGKQQRWVQRIKDKHVV